MPPAPWPGPLTRRYHGLLIAALPNPLGRYMMLNALCERIKLPDHGEFFAGPRQLANATRGCSLGGGRVSSGSRPARLDFPYQMAGRLKSACDCRTAKTLSLLTYRIAQRARPPSARIAFLGQFSSA